MINRSRRLTLQVAALGLVLAAALSGCSGENEPVVADPASPRAAAEPAESTAPPGPGDVQYVALGDSYASAPGVPQTDLSDGCFRSDRNYAHVLAEAQDLYLTDATCSGADSDKIISEQVPMLSPDTDVVTVGTGGNDFNLFISVLQRCLTRPDSAANGAGAEASTSVCAQFVGSDIAPRAAQIRAKMGEVLDAIGAAAPNAEIYVVGYPVILPTSGQGCPELVPIATADYPVVADVIRELSRALSAEAKARNLPFVDVYAASRGHDVCSAEPWVNGAQVGQDGTAPFHPFAVEQAAVAALVGDML